MKDLTPAQLENLKTITSQVKGEYKQLDLIDILNRIHLITNRSYDKCIEGFRLMLHHQLITAPFVLRLEMLDAMAQATSKIMPIFEALEAKPVKSGEFESLGRVVGVVALDGPTDDPDEGWQEQELKSASRATMQLAKEINNDIEKWQAKGSPSRPIDLSHINANF